VFRDEDYRSEPDGSNGSFIGYKPNIEELEMLLEAYFVQIDGTLNKLSHVIFTCPLTLLPILLWLGATIGNSRRFLEVRYHFNQNC